MKIMEIQNEEEIRPIFQLIDPGVLTSAPGTMMFITAKFFVLYIVGIGLLVLFIPASWKVISENKRQKEMNERMFTAQSRSYIVNQEAIPATQVQTIG